MKRKQRGLDLQAMPQDPPPLPPAATRTRCTCGRCPTTCPAESDGDYPEIGTETVPYGG
jgi:hypothetical protein